MAVSAKVVCSTKNDAGDGQTTLTFQPDYADGRNKEWAKYTPALGLTMVVLNEVADKFDAGASYTMILEKNND